MKRYRVMAAAAILIIFFLLAETISSYIQEKQKRRQLKIKEKRAQNSMFSLMGGS